LNILVCALADMGGEIYAMKIEDDKEEFISPNLQEDKIEFSLDEDFIKDFTRAHTSLDKPNRVEIECKTIDNEKFVEFIIGEAATHANKVKLRTPASFVIGISKLPFSANIIREIVLANKLSTSSKVYVNEEGLMKMEFVENEITSTYFIVRSSD
jgi:hypothetical protein